jgi:Family of unknown function (DUF5329)
MRSVKTRTGNRFMTYPARAVALVLGLGIASAAHATPSAGARREIDHLLRYIEDSRCSFDRDGTWYDADTAQAHVRMKYDFLLLQGRIGTAEDFIRRRIYFCGPPESAGDERHRI